jgi:hypothetical protein
MHMYRYIHIQIRKYIKNGNAMAVHMYIDNNIYIEMHICLPK